MEPKTGWRPTRQKQGRRRCWRVNQVTAVCPEKDSQIKLSCAQHPSTTSHREPAVPKPNPPFVAATVTNVFGAPLAELQKQLNLLAVEALVAPPGHDPVAWCFPAVPHNSSSQTTATAVVSWEQRPAAAGLDYKVWEWLTASSFCRSVSLKSSPLTHRRTCLYKRVSSHLLVSHAQNSTTLIWAS